MALESTQPLPLPPGVYPLAVNKHYYYYYYYYYYIQVYLLTIRITIPHLPCSCVHLLVNRVDGELNLLR